MASNQAKIFFFFGGGDLCFRQRGPRRKWPSWPSALNPPLCIVAKRCVLEQMLLLTAYKEVVYEKSIGTKMNDLDLFKVVSGNVNHCVSHSLLNILETVRDRGLIPKDHQ